MEWKVWWTKEIKRRRRWLSEKENEVRKTRSGGELHRNSLRGSTNRGGRLERNRDLAERETKKEKKEEKRGSRGEAGALFWESETEKKMKKTETSGRDREEEKKTE